MILFKLQVLLERSDLPKAQSLFNQQSAQTNSMSQFNPTFTFTYLSRVHLQHLYTSFAPVFYALDFRRLQ